MTVVDQMLARYPDDEASRNLALREVMQEIALAGLYLPNVVFKVATWLTGNYQPASFRRCCMKELIL